MARPAARITHQLRTRAGPPAGSAAISTRVMTPIVFWPSEVPWASATSEAVNAWPYLNPVSLWALGVLRVIR